jgi:multiple antibiotic resistance protein
MKVRRSLALRVAVNSFFVMLGSLLLGTVVLNIYGISVPIIRVSGGIVVAVSAWKLLTEGNKKEAGDAGDIEDVDYQNMAFYPLTLPLTTGPGTIAVMISLGFGRSRQPTTVEEMIYVASILVATLVVAAAVYVCFAYAGRVASILGRAGTDIAVRLSAFILLCIGVQILWNGMSELLLAVIRQ